MNFSANASPMLLGLVAWTLAVLKGGTDPVAPALASPLLALAWLSNRSFVPLRPWLLAGGATIAIGLAVACFGYFGAARVYWAEVSNSAVFFTIGWCGAVLAAGYDRSQLRVLLSLLVALGLFEAAYGLLEAARGSTSIFGIWDRRMPSGVLSGTFINRNHVVDLLSALWIITLALTLALRAQRSIRWLLAAGVCALFGMAVFATQSRLGVVAFAVGMTFFGVAAGRRARVQGGGAWLVGGTFSLALAAAVWFGLAGLVVRIMSLSEDVGRLALWQSMFDAPASLWWQGAGPGQFAEALRLFKPLAYVLDSTDAHNDYLQLVFEFGIVGSAAVLAAWVWWLRQTWQPRPGLVRLAVLAALLVFAIHALGDFALRIPGSGFLFWLAIGLAVNPALDQLGESRRRRRRRRSPI